MHQSMLYVHGRPYMVTTSAFKLKSVFHFAASLSLTLNRGFYFKYSIKLCSTLYLFPSLLPLVCAVQDRILAVLSCISHHMYQFC